MCKFMKAIAAIMLMVTVFCAAGCKKDPDNGGNNNGGGGNGGNSNPTTEGIYLGIIGFNYNLKSKDISLLNTSTKSSFTSFIDNLTTENLTALYYADYTALKKLKSFGQPPKLTNVALVTFTDGLDNASLDDSERNPENYPTREAYLNALSSKIRNDKVHGLDINAYTIGLRGNDVQDVAAFQNNLKKLASNDRNVFEVNSMDEALLRFEEIAESLHSTSITTSLSLLVPPGYDDGLVLRFTFDQVNSANNSSLFIECTYKRTSDGRRLDNITYHGFKQGATSLSSVEKLSNGFYKFVFQNLKKNDDSFITEIDKQRLKLYRQIFTGWEPETEFDNNNQSSVIEEHSSALIMLVLDCTTSLGSQFSSLKTGAKRFVEILVSANGGGGSIPTVTTSGATDITINSAKCGGNVTDEGGYSVTERGICWNTSPNPTISDNHASSGSGTGNFTANMTGLSESTTYYVRAYAKNIKGTAYGNQTSFGTGSSSLVEKWFYYDNNNYNDSWGWVNGGDFQWAVMFPSSILSQYSGTSITKVKAYLGNTGSYTLKIYSGGTSSPSTLLKTQSFNVTSSGWKEITVSPLTLNTNQSLWISLIGNGYVAGACDGTGNRNARWINSSSGWVDAMETNDGEDLTWMIRTYVTNSAKGEKGLEIELPHNPKGQEGFVLPKTSCQSDR